MKSHVRNKKSNKYSYILNNVAPKLEIADIIVMQ